MKKQTWKFGWVKQGEKPNWKYGTSEEAEAESKNNVIGAVWFCLPVDNATELTKAFGIQF